VFAAAFSVVEAVFGRGGIARHPFALGVGEGLSPQVFQRKGSGPTVKGRRQGTDQPIFQDPDAANTAFIEIVPVVQQILEIHLERDLLQQAPQGALERDLIRLLLELIPRKMEIMPPACRLPREIAEVQEIVGAHEHVDDARRITHGFKPVELIEQLGTPGDMHEMLRFINDDRLHPVPRHGLFPGMA
jgi:hypothetical protein